VNTPAVELSYLKKEKNSSQQPRTKAGFFIALIFNLELGIEGTVFEICFMRFMSQCDLGQKGALRSCKAPFFDSI
jgi:hypothetical protein